MSPSRDRSGGASSKARLDTTSTARGEGGAAGIKARKSPLRHRHSYRSTETARAKRRGVNVNWPPHCGGGHSCNTRLRCLIVNLHPGHLVMNRSKIGEQHFADPLPIPAPLLDLPEVAPVGVERVVGFFVGPVVGGHLSGSRDGLRFGGLLCGRVQFVHKPPLLGRHYAKHIPR